jgi:hypothetical protein
MKAALLLILHHSVVLCPKPSLCVKTSNHKFYSQLSISVVKSSFALASSIHCGDHLIPLGSYGYDYGTYQGDYYSSDQAAYGDTYAYPPVYPTDGTWFEIRYCTENVMPGYNALTYVTFDPYEELVWTGSAAVRRCLSDRLISCRIPAEQELGKTRVLCFDIHLLQGPSRFVPNARSTTIFSCTGVRSLAFVLFHCIYPSLLMSCVKAHRAIVRQLLAEEYGVISIAPGSLRMLNRGGMFLLTYR